MFLLQTKNKTLEYNYFTIVLMCSGCYEEVESAKHFPCELTVFWSEHLNTENFKGGKWWRQFVARIVFKLVWLISNLSGMRDDWHTEYWTNQPTKSKKRLGNPKNKKLPLKARQRRIPRSCEFNFFGIKTAWAYNLENVPHLSVSHFFRKALLKCF